MSTQNIKTPATQSRRWRWLGGVLGAVLAIGLGYSVYWAQVLRYHQIDRRRLRAAATSCRSRRRSPAPWWPSAPTTPQFVKAGQPLVRLDQADAKVALEQAEAQLARTVREVRNLFATSAAAARRACSCGRPIWPPRRATLTRRERLASHRARSPGRNCKHARDAVKAARRRACMAAREQLAANRARVDGTTVEEHPHVRDAAARGARGLPRAVRAPSCRRRSPASSPGAPCSSASA